MGRKSAAKQQSRLTSPTGDPAPPEPPGSARGLIIAALVLLLTVVGLIAYTRSSASNSSQASSSLPSETAVASTATSQAPNEPTAAKLVPHPQANLPPLPFNPTPPARPDEVVRAAYKFAAEHPEVLSYMPCYCGCERSGHRGNEDCFVTRRDGNGDVVEWEPHGMT